MLGVEPLANSVVQCGEVIRIGCPTYLNDICDGLSVVKLDLHWRLVQIFEKRGQTYSRLNQHLEVWQRST